MGGDSSSTADGKKRKAKKLKRGLVSTEQDDVAILPILLPCSTKADSENWFEDGKFLFLRCKNIEGGFLRGKRCLNSWFIFMIPTKCLHLSDIITHQSKTTTTTTISHKKKKKKKKMFNHSLTHTFPAHFSLPYASLNELHAELKDASWIVLGSTVYFFGVADEVGSFDSIYYLERNVAGTTFATASNHTGLNLKKAGCMVRERRVPKVVALDGKVYVFGNNKDAWGEVFEPCSQSVGSQSRILSSPMISSQYDLLFVVAIELDRKIVVGFSYKIVDEELVGRLSPDVLTTRTTILVYDVVLDSWEEHDNNFFIDSSRLLCQPIGVSCCLYWLDTKLRTYDLSTRRYYEGCIEDCLFHVVKSDEIENLKISLFHLGGDIFCMTWVDNLNSTVLHATTIQILKTTTKLEANLFKLCATMSSCQSFASTISLVLQDRTLIL